MTSSEKLNEYRQKQGWTQEECAQHLGYKDKSSISKLESSSNPPSIRIVRKWADALKLPSNYFYPDSFAPAVDVSINNIIKGITDILAIAKDKETHDKLEVLLLKTIALKHGYPMKEGDIS